MRPQVDGCHESLRELKEYHQRYKICEHHLKLPCIIREGVKQRFCQQCGRFHDMVKFDGDKRSCRARLQVFVPPPPPPSRQATIAGQADERPETYTAALW